MKGKAVIFEDDVVVLDLLAESLERLGFEAIIVSNGLQGLEVIYENNPQLIFIDPDIKGISVYQICKLLKNKEEYRSIPIIILAEEPKDKLKFWSIKAGADDYLVKPFDRDTITFQLEELLKKFSSGISITTFLSKAREFNNIVTNLSQNYQTYSDLNFTKSQELLQQLIETIVAMLKSELGSLMIFDKTLDSLVIKAAVGLNEDIIKRTKVKMGEGISGWVAEQNRPLLISNVEREDRFYRENSQKYSTASFLSVPVKLGANAGVININNKVNKEIYESNDLHFLLLLVNQISFAFECSKLHKKLNEIGSRFRGVKNVNKILIEANQMLDRELYETTISNEVNKIVTANLDYHQTVNAVIGIVEELVDFHFCGLLLIDEEYQGELIISLKEPSTESEIENFKLRIIDSFNELTHKVLLRENVRLNHPYNRDIISEGEKEDHAVNSFQAQLLHNSERVIGLLAMSNSKEGAFNEEDSKLFSIVAQRSIPAINNAGLHRKIRELSNRDGLTGLFCYRYFREQFEREIKRAERYKETVGMIMLDIDNFKLINDTYGHMQGDAILRELSLILNKVCRTVDIIARYGGEEFVVILPKTDKAGAFYLAERMRRVIKNYDFSSLSNDEVIKLTVSLGVVSYPGSADSAAELIEKADKALYQVKKEGKNATYQV